MTEREKRERIYFENQYNGIPDRERRRDRGRKEKDRNMTEITIKCSCGNTIDSTAEIMHCYLENENKGCVKCIRICPICGIQAHIKHFRNSKKYGKKSICKFCKEENEK